MSLTPFQNRFLSRQALGIGLVGWLLPLGLFGLGGCLAKGADQQAAVSLRQLAQERGLLWGAAVQDGQLADQNFSKLLKAQAGLIVPENSLKWDQLQPEHGKFDFSKADGLLDFANNNKMSMRGHVLVWHQQLPAWLGSLNKQDLAMAMQQHINTVVSHYRGKLQSWDVLNEIIAEDGNGLRKSIWLDNLGPQYIDQALLAAHKADPNVPLVINDYGLEGDDPKTARKRATLLSLLKDLRSRGIPLQAVGLQAHLAATPTGPTFNTLPDFLHKLAALNLDVYITELDVNDSQLAAGISGRDKRVADIYEDFLSVVTKDPNVKLVATWGLSDRFSWLNQAFPRSDHLPQRPLPFDMQEQIKPATKSIIKVLSNQK